MAYFLQQLINGIALGSIYGLIAIGYTMVYGIVGMINFAHGDIFMVGAFIALIAFLLIMSLGVTLIPLALVLVLIIAMLLTAMWGWTVERIAYRPLARVVPPGAADHRHRHVDHSPELHPGGARRAGEAAPAGDHRRLPDLRGGRLRRQPLQHPDPHRGHDRGADGRVLAHHHPHRARPRAARLRAGPADGGAVGRECRPHHLAHLRHRRLARRRGRPALPALLRRDRFLSSASSPASRPSPRRCSAASARCPAPCSAASSSA